MTMTPEGARVLAALNAYNAKERELHNSRPIPDTQSLGEWRCVRVDTMRAALAAADEVAASVAGVTTPAASELRYADRYTAIAEAAKIAERNSELMERLEDAPSTDREIEGKPAISFTSDGQIESNPEIDREKLIAEARVALTAISGGFEPQGHIIQRLIDALASPVVVDEAKLAEVIAAAYEPDAARLQGVNRHDLRAAHAVAEWLRGGAR